MRSYEDVDEYIANASDVTRPILVKLRKIFQQASPKLKEEIKWGVPCYTYKGPVGGLAAYKAHVTWGLWKAGALSDPDRLIGGVLRGGKIKSIAEIPPAENFISLIKQAVELNETGIKVVTPDPELPSDFAAAINKNKGAAKYYANFTPARKWQYVNWIMKAKRPETRATRIETAVVRIGAGKAIK